MISRFGSADPQKVENGPAQIQSTAAEECGPGCEDLVPFLHTFPHLEIGENNCDNRDLEGAKG